MKSTIFVGGDGLNCCEDYEDGDDAGGSGSGSGSGPVSGAASTVPSAAAAPAAAPATTPIPSPASPATASTEPKPAPAVDFGPWNGEIESLEESDWFRALPDDRHRQTAREGLKTKLTKLHRGWLEKTTALSTDRKTFEETQAATVAAFEADRRKHADAAAEFEAAKTAQRESDQKWLIEMLAAEADDTLSAEMTRLKGELETLKAELDTARKSGVPSAGLEQMKAEAATLKTELEQTKALAAEKATAAERAEAGRSEANSRLILAAIRHKAPAIVGDETTGAAGNDEAFEELCNRLEKRVEKNGGEMFSEADLDAEIANVVKLFPDLSGDLDQSMAAAETGAGSGRSGLVGAGSEQDYWKLLRQDRFGNG